LRGMYGIASPAPICTDDSQPQGAGQLDCQVVQAPDSAERLVTHNVPSAFAPRATGDKSAGIDGEIRLTYRELSALIEDALRALK
jgi:hypothetical protein